MTLADIITGGVFTGAAALAVTTIAHALGRNWPKINAAYRGAWFVPHDHRPPLVASNDFLPESTNTRRAA